MGPKTRNRVSRAIAIFLHLDALICNLHFLVGVVSFVQMSNPRDRLWMLHSHIRHKQLSEYQPEFPMMHRLEREKYLHSVFFKHPCRLQLTQPMKH